MQTTYDIDISRPDHDSLEAVMGQVYTDLFNQLLEDRAKEAFWALLRLFTRRLADTTNDMVATNKRWLYRILTQYLAGGVEPTDITIVTFNQDLQAEKELSLMRATARWERWADQLLNFPNCYAIGTPRVTSPRRARGHDLFDEEPPRNDCVRVLKLHGSLNWYSTHTSANPSPKALFNPSRSLAITRRKIIQPAMQYTGGRRATHALPVVVPPVTHKSAVLHDVLREVWRLAEDAIAQADELVVFGYSCPPLDFESSNLLRRAQKDRETLVSLIDPDPAAASRYAQLLMPSRLYRYPSAKAFLADTTT